MALQYIHDLTSGCRPVLVNNRYEEDFRSVVKFYVNSHWITRLTIVGFETDCILTVVYSLRSMNDIMHQSFVSPGLGIAGT